MRQDPRPMRVKLISHTEYPLETLYLVWMQSREDRDNWPSTSEIRGLLRPDFANRFKHAQFFHEIGYLEQAKPIDPDLLGAAYTRFISHFHDTIDMLMNEAVPVAENIHFTFLLENVSISLREQLVRHRIGTAVGPRVGVDIAPTDPSPSSGEKYPIMVSPSMAPGSLTDVLPGSTFTVRGETEMVIRQIPDLAESTFWSQTARVVPWDDFFNKGRYIVPDSLKGKKVTLTVLQTAIHVYTDTFATCCNFRVREDDPNSDDVVFDVDAEEYYVHHMHQTQIAYSKLTDAGVPLEDARNLIPLAATHSITWTLNLKAMMHIFGKRSSWIAQANVWEDVMAGMVEALVKISPTFKILTQPQCFKKGKYVGCPVSGTNLERIRGTDGDMPPCPIFITNETELALNAYGSAEAHEFEGSAWSPNIEGNVADIRNWQSKSSRSREMLMDNAKRFSRLWHMDVFVGGGEDAGT